MRHPPPPAGGIAARRLALLLLALAAVFAATISAPARAQTPELGELIETWDQKTAQAEAALDEPAGIATEQIAGWREVLEKQRAEMRAARAAVTERARPFRDQLDALGPPPEDGATESDGVAAERARLNEALEAVEAEGKRIDLAATRTATALQRLAELRAQRFTESLLSAGPSALDPATWVRAAADIEVAISRVLVEIRRTLAEDRMVALRDPLFLMVVGLVLGIVLRGVAVRWLMGKVKDSDRFLRRALIALGIAAARLFLPVLALALVLSAITMSGVFGTYTEALVHGLRQGMLAIIGAYVFAGIYFAPRAGQLRLSGFPDDAARGAASLTVQMAVVFGLDRVAQVGGAKVGLVSETFTAINVILIGFGAWILWRLSAVIRRAARGAAPAIPEPASDDAETAPSEPLATTVQRLLARLFQLSAVAAPVLALTGFYQASRFAIYPLVATTAVLGVCMIVSRASRLFIENQLTGQESEGRSRLRLLPLLIGLTLSIAATPVLVLIWGGDSADIAALWSFLVDGFQVGEVEIRLADFLTLIVVFTIGYMLTRVLQNVVRRSVLPNAGIDTGAASALTAGLGYAGIIIAAVVAISAAGLDLSNLAIVAGALSVGIGFGLQNIVNNFVSGIILLIERPIKVGDWVQLTSGQGYVKRINVRATEIQTFDRSSLFVPNSELISGAVTNWTHLNNHGRIIVKVGVAYGTDVRLVEKILLEIAEAHSMITHRPGPYVLFHGFGADSLDFEIRGVLRDVNWILNVTSDINFEIYRRFAEAGIEIPFRQHDLHLKDPDGIAAALRARPGEAREPDAPDEDATVPEAPPPPGEGAPDDGNGDGGDAR